jgi:glucokinase
VERKRCAIGIDLGGTKIGIGVVDTDGAILEEHKLPTRGAGAEAVIADIVDVIQPLLQRIEYQITSLGIGIAGQVSATDGVVLFAPNLKWQNIPLKSRLQQLLNVPVMVCNDVRAATYGEWYYGAGRNCDDFVCLFVGTGIGGGIVCNGRLLTGSSNSAGEIGHTTLVWRGRLCSCGNKGCLEAYASGWGIAKTLQESITAQPQLASVLLHLVGGQVDHLRSEHLSLALAKEAPFAREILEELADALAAGCVSFVNMLNPRRLLLGGGVMQGLPELLPLVEEQIRQRALAAATQNLEVVPAALAEKAPLIGAAIASVREMQGQYRE